MPKQNDDTNKFHKTREVFQIMFITHRHSSEIAQTLWASTREAFG